MCAYSESILSRRYRILHEIGRGGMGIVYCAHDRLTGQNVALKSVTLSSKASIHESDNLRYTLAQEFKLLASLRHPHIVSVLDYGFDAIRKPYFTMELLEGHQTLLDYAQSVPIAQQVLLLIQMLQALAYLHRRGILHRDIKPENVMVVNGQLKMLDFGLATLIQQQHPQEDTAVVGTVAYIAPEILNNQPYTQASDLYAVGVMAYQMFAKRHPFDMSNIHALLRDIAFTEADTANLDIPVDLQAWLADMLTKNPAERIANATFAIQTLSNATGFSMSADSLTIRESYLQSADFVGRDNEMATLTHALQSALKGKGSAWLIGGESGVGKSRLVDEIRTQALISGALVLRSSMQRDSGLPYELWRVPLRHLALESDIPDTVAAILRPLIPDIETLLEREIAASPELGGREGQQRLVGAITDLIRQQTRPIVLIMEDLHWAVESLEPLKPLVNMAQHLPFMFIGNYRNDELADLAERLPNVNSLTLERLTREEILHFTAHIIGTENIHEPVIDFLNNQTEGNAFFIVEVIRALADNAGSLSQIGRMTLPHNIYAGGVQHVFQQRLERIPFEAYPLLELASVIGRDILPEVLAECAPRVDIDAWLLTCAEAAVLEVVDERWRFTHDKLREGILANIPALRLRELHRTAALGIEATTTNLLDNTPALMLHWGIAGNTEREAIYARITGEMQLNICAYHDAIVTLDRALAITPPNTTAEREHLRARLTLQLGEAYLGISDYTEAHYHFNQAEALTQPLEDNTPMRDTLMGDIFQKQGLLSVKKGDYPTARDHLTRGLDHSRKAKDWRTLAMSLSHVGEIEINLGNYDIAETYLNQALEIGVSTQDNYALALIYRTLSKLCYQRGNVDAGWPHLRAALEAVRQTGDRYGLARVLNAHGVFNATQGNYTAASHDYTAAIEEFRAIGDKWGEDVITNNLGFIHLFMGEFHQAATEFYQAIEGLWQMQVIPVLLESLVGLARVLAEVGRDAQAVQIIGMALNHPATIKDVEVLSQHATDVLKSRFTEDAYQQRLGEGCSLALEDVIHALFAEKQAVLSQLGNQPSA